MKKYVLYFLILAPFTLALKAQPYYNPLDNNPVFRNSANFGPKSDPYNKGYIVMKGDTVSCLIKDFNQMETQRIVYKLSKDDKTQKVNIKDITELRTSDGLYKKIIYKYETYLMRIVIKDTVTLYEVSETHDDSFGVRTHSIFFLERANTLDGLGRNNYKEVLRKMLNGNPEIEEKIAKLEYKDLSSFIRAFVNNYNEWLAKKK